MSDQNFENASKKSIIIRFWYDYIKPKKSLVILCLVLLALVAFSFAIYPAIIGWVFDALGEKDTRLLYQLAVVIIVVSIIKALAVYRQIQVVNKLVFSIIEEILFAAAIPSCTTELKLPKPLAGWTIRSIAVIKPAKSPTLKSTFPNLQVPEIITIEIAIPPKISKIGSTLALPTFNFITLKKKERLLRL